MKSAPGLAVFCLTILSCTRPQPPPHIPPVDPRLISISGPRAAKLDARAAVTLWFSIESENLDPLSRAPIELTLTDRGGNSVPVSLTTDLTEQRISLGEGEIGVRLPPRTPTAGLYRVCARLQTVAQPACTTITLEESTADSCREAFTAAKAAAGFACVCRSARIHAADVPHPALGSTLPMLFDDIGGNTLGAFDSGGIRMTPKFTSIFKYEMHFEVGFVNPPPVPPNCDEDLWIRLMIGECLEGQRHNGSWRRHVGQPYERRLSPYTAPFDPRPSSVMMNPGWFDRPGYMDDDIAGAPLKAHDPPRTIHWVFAFGPIGESSASWLGLGDVRADIFVHAFVRASGPPGGDCNCYFELHGVFNQQGPAGSWSMRNPRCFSPL